MYNLPIEYGTIMTQFECFTGSLGSLSSCFRFFCPKNFERWQAPTNGILSFCKCMQVQWWGYHEVLMTLKSYFIQKNLSILLADPGFPGTSLLYGIFFTSNCMKMKTRMHSSRMHTVRCSSCLLGGERCLSRG